MERSTDWLKNLGAHYRSINYFTLCLFCLHFPAVQQLEFLEGRKKQYMKAALQAKQKNDMEQAKIFLRTAKSFEPMIEAARSGKTVDISTVSRQWIYASYLD